MSSCISGGGGRTYRIDIDIVKSPSTSTRTSHSTSPSSTLSESSNSPLAISTRKPRTPRKRPNQTYNEAAALLSTVYPNIFSTKNLKNLSKNTKVFDSFVEEFSELLPPSPTFNAEFLLQPPIPSNPMFRIEPKRSNSVDKACLSPNYDSQSISYCPVSPALNGEFAPHRTIQDKSMVQLESKPTNSCEKICQSPCYDSQLSSWSPRDTYQEDFDADSILDEEIEEGIDSIMGNLSMENDSHEEANSSCFINQTSTYHWNPMGLGFGGKFDFGFGMGGGRGRVRALRHVDDGDWWRYPTVDILDISPKLKKIPREKKKKKVERVEDLKKEESSSKETSNSNSVPTPKPNSAALGLKLNHEEVLNAWSDRGSPFSDDIAGAESLESDAIARLAQIDLFSENGGLREASVLRYREKRRSRLFSKKIRYEVRKVNADRRPRMKGRFVRRPPPTQNGQETKRK